MPVLLSHPAGIAVSIPLTLLCEGGRLPNGQASVTLRITIRSHTDAYSPEGFLLRFQKQ